MWRDSLWRITPSGLVFCRDPRCWIIPRGPPEASWLRQVESYLRDTDMAGLVSAWVMARRRPKDHRRNVDARIPDRTSVHGTPCYVHQHYHSPRSVKVRSAARGTRRAAMARKWRAEKRQKREAARGASQSYCDTEEHRICVDPRL